MIRLTTRHPWYNGHISKLRNSVHSHVDHQALEQTSSHVFSITWFRIEWSICTSPLRAVRLRIVNQGAAELRDDPWRIPKHAKQ